MRLTVRTVAALSRLAGIAAAAMVLVAVLVVCQMVVQRYFLHQSSIWQTEFVTYLLIAATFLGTPYVLLVGGHVRVEALTGRLPPRLAAWSRGVALAVVAAVAGVVAWAGASLWWEAWTNGWRSDTVWGVRLWIPYAALPAGFGLTFVQALALLWEHLAGRAPPTGAPGDGG